MSRLNYMFNKVDINTHYLAYRTCSVPCVLYMLSAPGPRHTVNITENSSTVHVSRRVDRISYETLVPSDRSSTRRDTVRQVKLLL